MCRPGLRGVPQAEGTAPFSGDGWQHRLWNCNRAGESLPTAHSRLVHLLSFHAELIPIISKQTPFKTFRATAKTFLLLLLMKNINKTPLKCKTVYNKTARFGSLKRIYALHSACHLSGVFYSVCSLHIKLTNCICQMHSP